MKLPNQTASLLTAVLACVSLAAQAQTPVLKADNNTPLDQTGSWVGGALPNATTSQAVWDSTITTVANCTNNSAANSLNWGGIVVSNPPAPVKVTTTVSSKKVNIGQYGVDLSNASQDLWLAMGTVTAADQTWVIAPGRRLTMADATYDATVQNNVLLMGHLSYVNTIKVQNAITFTVTNGATIDTAPAAIAGAIIYVGNNATGPTTLLQMGGTVNPKRTDGTTGSPKTSLDIANAASSTGTYTITNGTLADLSTPATTAFVVADGSSSTGTLNVDGTASVTAGSIRLANNNGATGTVNVTNGTVLVNGGTFDVGRTTTGGVIPGPGTLNVYGGTVTSIGGMNVPHGNGPGAFNLNNGAVLLGGSLNVPDSGSAGSGVVTISGGSLTISNSLNLPNGGSGTGTVNLNGGVLTLNSVATHSIGVTNTGTFNFNGGTLRARQGAGNFIASSNLTVNVGANGAIVDSAGYNVTIQAGLLNGGGTDGGLTKLGLGALTLQGANTYNGPTVVNGGALWLYTTNYAGGGISVTNGALFHVIVGSAGSTLNCSSLTLGTVGASVGGVVTNEFDFDGFTNPSIPIINAASLQAAGTVYVNVTATGLGLGTYHLIQYGGGSIGGGDYAFAAGVISGAVGRITNNTSTHYVDLVITSLPSLVWRAQVNTNWDTSTPNWVDGTSLLQTTYPNGASVLFDDSTANPLVYVTAAYSPASVNANNSAKDYSFIGVGRISGFTGFTKTGSGAVTMALTNDYSGDTVISNGTYRLGMSNVIPDGAGRGDVTLEGALDLAGFSETINGLIGTNGIIDNTSNSPASLSIGNGNADGVFAGLITNSAGSLALAKQGSGTLLLLAKNGYTGGTTAGGGGILELAYEQSIGPGPLTINGGCTLGWTDTAAHMLANPLTINGGAAFGLPANGPLTVPGTVNFAAGGRALTCNTDVLFQNGMTNGGFSGKSGLGTLTLRNFAGPDWSFGSFALNNGTLVLDNAAAIEHTNNIRIQCSVAGGTARLVVTNGSSLTTQDSATSNFRFGDSASAGTDATNILDLAGTLTITAYAGSNDKLQMGSSTDPTGQNVLNLLPGGVLRVRQVLDQSPNSISTFNFNGGTLIPNDSAYATMFITNLDYCNVLDGGAIIDTAGYDIGIPQPLLLGGTGVGGLTKKGLGKLSPNGYNTYTGPTVVQAGTLAGTGTFLSPVTVQSGAALAPGGAFLAMYINNDLTLDDGSSTLVEVGNNGGTLQSDSIYSISTLRYGGTLQVTNVGPNGFQSGNSFTLFSASTYRNGFAAFTLPVLQRGLSWQTSSLTTDGSLRVTGTALPPSFTTMSVHNGTNLVLGGLGGTGGTLYDVATSTDLTVPVANWSIVGTYRFDASGNFRFTNSVDSAVSQQFFAIFPR